jgi:hypothetical protein
VSFTDFQSFRTLWDFVAASQETRSKAVTRYIGGMRYTLIE